MTGAGWRDQFSAGGLALLVHVLFFAALVLGVSWKTLPQVPVYADLWSALPSRPAAPPEPAPPEPIKPPEPAKPPPPEKPAVKATVPEAKSAPDIALKEKRRQQEEARRREEAARQRAILDQQRVQEEERQRKLALDKQRQEEDRQRQLALDKQRQEAERKRAELERKRLLEEEIEREEMARLAQEEKQLRDQRERQRKAAEVRQRMKEMAELEIDDMFGAEAAEALAAEVRRVKLQASAAARVKQIDDYKARIRDKIQALVIVPETRGKPEAVYRVELFPNGEVMKVIQVRSSGQPAYDRAVERAIAKASPFPLPADKEAAAAFRDALELKFRPE